MTSAVPLVFPRPTKVTVLPVVSKSNLSNLIGSIVPSEYEIKYLSSSNAVKNISCSVKDILKVLLVNETFLNFLL